ncbi:uncharacterized protein [Rhodnius prolixus]|uniref:uncharacterized protein n=1 Tax=Rhodnius prolixus TaxID=13249 RepID=UPI003D18C9BA
MDELKRMLTELRNDLVKEMEQNRKVVSDEINKFLKQTTDKLEVFNAKINFVEREFRHKNIIIYGIEDEFRSYWDLENYIIEFINSKLELNLSASDFDHIRRLGRKEEGRKSRPILLKLTTLRNKLMIVKNSFKLRGCKIFISEDYNREEKERRKLFYPQLLEARKQGKYAVLRHDKLIIRDSRSGHDTLGPLKAEKKGLLSDSLPSLLGGSVKNKGDNDNISKRNKAGKSKNNGQ